MNALHFSIESDFVMEMLIIKRFLSLLSEYRITYTWSDIAIQKEKREKNEPKTSQIKRMYCGQWIEVDYHWYGYGYGLWTIDSGWPNGTFLSSLYCVNAFMLLTLFQFSLWSTCQDSFTSLNSMRYSNRLTAPVSLHWTLCWILRYWAFSMVIRIKLYK